MSKLALAAALLALVACNTSPPEQKVAVKDPAASAAPSAAAVPTGALHLGQPIEANATPAKLADIAKEPKKYAQGTYATTGTVTAVCEHMGCWMEIKDDASEAHIKMAGHAFFVPKNASGKKAKVLAQVVVDDADEGCADDKGDKNTMSASGAGAGAKTAKDDKHEKKGCRGEAEEQMGHPLAKLELVALGVELYD